VKVFLLLVFFYPPSQAAAVERGKEKITFGHLDRKSIEPCPGGILKLNAAGASRSEIFHSECENEQSYTRKRVIHDQNGRTASGYLEI
jgi:hypothetical protein